MKPVNSPDAPSASGGYAQAVRVEARQLLFVSGQIPVDVDGAVPAAFADQCRLVWRNVEAQLGAGGFALADIVKVTTFLSDRAWAQENSAILPPPAQGRGRPLHRAMRGPPPRDKLGEERVLAGLTPALTIIIAGIYDPAWLLEVEVIAAR